MFVEVTVFSRAFEFGRGNFCPVLFVEALIATLTSMEGNNAAL
jgi:hypothetical protein